MARKLLSACALILCSIVSAGQARPYFEQYRPQVHFSPRKNWINDPNGLVYFRGEYHLFYQFNPFGDQWGHMSWGHAVSSDLLHWNELPVAIPEKDGEMVFTGSVVVERGNTSGFCTPQKECLVAIYTGHRVTASETRQTQNLAYSLDNGRSWMRYEKNPVLDLHKADFRDPSVAWDEKGKRWRMAVSLPFEHKVAFYGSPDLKHWNELSEFGPAGNVNGVWECPDLLQIPGEKGTRDMWALKVGLNPGAPQGGSGEQYFLGQFDGRRFVPSPTSGNQGWTNYGKDDYCAINFNGLDKNAKPVLLGWMNNWEYASKLPTSSWRGQMSLPRRLSIVSDAAGVAIRQEPVIEPLREQHTQISAVKSGPQTIEAPFELDLKFDRSAGKAFGVRLYTDDAQWSEIGFDRNKREFYIDRTHSGAEIAPRFAVRTVAPLVEARPFDVRLIVDWSSIEAYAQNGTIAMTDLIFPPSMHNRIELFSDDTSVSSLTDAGRKSTKISIPVTGDLWSLRSIWMDDDRHAR